MTHLGHHGRGSSYGLSDSSPCLYRGTFTQRRAAFLDPGAAHARWTHPSPHPSPPCAGSAGPRDRSVATTAVAALVLGLAVGLRFARVGGSRRGLSGSAHGGDGVVVAGRHGHGLHGQHRTQLERVGTSALAGFPTDGSTFAILTNGSADAADGPNGNEDDLPDISDDVSTNLGGATTRGGAFDATVLRVGVTVPAGANCLSVDFRFLSEEYPEFLQGMFNDSFLAELDPVSPGSSWRISGSGGCAQELRVRPHARTDQHQRCRWHVDEPRERGRDDVRRSHPDPLG